MPTTQWAPARALAGESGASSGTWKPTLTIMCRRAKVCDPLFAGFSIRLGMKILQQEVVQIVPNAKRLVQGYRDIGYTFNGAVADLVDNAIAAQATEVRIDMVWDGHHSYLVISDNGDGMTRAQLEEAMRLGSDQDYNSDDLGKFGLGLKTASISQCKVLQVGSRPRGIGHEVDVLRFDIDHIETTNNWEVIRQGPETLPTIASEWLAETHGTVIVWSNLDRLLGGTNNIDKARNAFFDHHGGLGLHLAMVFHRFLSGDERTKHQHPAEFRIILNGLELAPWDPFATWHEKTQTLAAQDFPLAGVGWGGIVEMQPYILPAKEQFNDPKEHELLSGPKKWNNQQGFYIYRANRMIQSGGWCGLLTPNEHYKLARVTVDFPPQLDNAFGINIAKMRVTLPAQLKDEVKAYVGPIRKAADLAYNAKERNKIPAVGPGSTPPPLTPPKRPGVAVPGISSSGTAKQGALGPFAPWPAETLRETEQSRRRMALETAAKITGNESALEAILKALASTDERTARELGW